MLLLILILKGMSEKLYDDGNKDITNIDFSEIVIEQMKAKYANKSGLTCKTHSLQ